MKLKVRKHKWETVRTIDGKVKRHMFLYTVAVRKWGLFWFDLKFYISKTIHPGEKTDRIVNTEMEVLCRPVFGHKYATFFPEEADAIRVKFDIINRPDKYVNK